MKLRILQAAILFATTAAIAGYSPVQAQGPQKFEIVTKKYAFEPAEITVHKGQAVTLELTSRDTTHGLIVKELGIKTEVKKGGTSEVTFTPEKEGTFTGSCAHFCGIGHGSMKLKIHVVS